MYGTSISGGWARLADLDRSHLSVKEKCGMSRNIHFHPRHKRDASGLRVNEIDPMPMLTTSMSAPETFVCISISVCISMYIYIYRERERERGGSQFRTAPMLPSINGAQGLSTPIHPSHRHNVCPSCPQRAPLVQTRAGSSLPFTVTNVLPHQSTTLSPCTLPWRLQLKRLTRLLEVVFHRVRGAKMEGRPSPAVFA